MLFYLAAATGIITVIILSNMIKKSFILSFIGINSLIFLSLHEFVVYRLLNFILRYLLGRGILNETTMIFENVIYVILAVAILIPVSYFINKYMPFMLGRKNIDSGGILL